MTYHQPSPPKPPDPFPRLDVRLARSLASISAALVTWIVEFAAGYALQKSF